jgi:hypothetical protein
LVQQILAQLRTDPKLADPLVRLDESATLAELIERHRRRKGWADLKEIVEDRKTREREIQKVLQGHTWMFGALRS